MAFAGQETTFGSAQTVTGCVTQFSICWVGDAHVQHAVVHVQHAALCAVFSSCREHWQPAMAVTGLAAIKNLSGPKMKTLSSKSSQNQKLFQSIPHIVKLSCHLLSNTCMHHAGLTALPPACSLSLTHTCLCQSPFTWTLTLVCCCFMVCRTPAHC